MSTILIMLIAAAAALLVEKLWPANELPKVRNWWPRVFLTNFSQAAIVFVIGRTAEPWLASDLTPPWAVSRHLSLPAQIILGYIVTSFIYYWWHRIRHDSPFFWRLCHQLHHSPQRLEVLMSFYKHPVEITLNALLSSLIAYPLLGCSPQAAALITLATGIAELFYHWNIRTPHWLGPIFQRPESHRVHHQRHHHTNNYSDIPLWDILFGTYQNPNSPIKKCGFDKKVEDRFDDMLAFRDAHQAERQKLAPLHLLPTCIGCSKRWACHQSRSSHNSR